MCLGFAACDFPAAATGCRSVLLGFGAVRKHSCPTRMGRSSQAHRARVGYGSQPVVVAGRSAAPSPCPVIELQHRD